MRLFDVVPPHFFGLLAGKNRDFYAEAALLLYEQYRVHQFGIQYDIMRDLLQELIEAREDEGETYDMVEEQDTLETLDSDLFRVKANTMLRRMREQKWIDVEVRNSFQPYIVLPHYSSRILAVFESLCQARSVEYQRFAFTTYQVMTGEEARRNPSMAVMEAERLSAEFVEELRVLVNNMKHHMEQVVEKTSVQDVLTHHFEEYKANIIDRSYHRLKTSDHVSRYRRSILEIVQTWLIDSDKFDSLVLDGLAHQVAETKELVAVRLREALLSISEVYTGLDEMFLQIDTRHNQYLRASFDRARYLTQETHNTDQMIAKLLEGLSEQIRLYGDIDNSDLQMGFTLQKSYQMLPSSLYTPRRKRADHQPENLPPRTASKLSRQEAREKNLERLRSAITREKVEQTVLVKLAERLEMDIAEIAPQNAAELPEFLYVYLYGYDPSTKFKIVRNPGETSQVNGYSFAKHKLVRRKLEKR